MDPADRPRFSADPKWTNRAHDFGPGLGRPQINPRSPSERSGELMGCSGDAMDRGDSRSGDCMGCNHPMGPHPGTRRSSSGNCMGCNGPPRGTRSSRWRRPCEDSDRLGRCSGGDHAARAAHTPLAPFGGRSNVVQVKVWATLGRRTETLRNEAELGERCSAILPGRRPRELSEGRSILPQLGQSRSKIPKFGRTRRGARPTWGGELDQSWAETC